MGVWIGGQKQSGSGSVTAIERLAATDGTLTTFDFTTDLSTADMQNFAYEIYFSLKKQEAGTANLYLLHSDNGAARDTTTTNYYTSLLSVNAGTVASARNNSPYICDLPATADPLVGKITLIRHVGGFVVSIVDAFQYSPSANYMIKTHHANKTAYANWSGVSLRPASGHFASGSWAVLYKTAITV